MWKDPLTLIFQTVFVLYCLYVATVFLVLAFNLTRDMVNSRRKRRQETLQYKISGQDRKEEAFALEKQRWQTRLEAEKTAQEEAFAVEKRRWQAQVEADKTAIECLAKE